MVRCCFGVDMCVVDVVVMVFAKAGVSRAECPLKVEIVHFMSESTE